MTVLEVKQRAIDAANEYGSAVTTVFLILGLFSIAASLLLVFLIFVREYSTGIYLLGPGTEVIGSLLVSLWGTGAVDLVSALSVVNVVMIGLGLIIAIRLGVRLHG